MSESKANRTRNLRYKRPALASMGWQSIWEELDAIQEACSDIHWFADQDDETLLNALDGDDEDVWEFKLAFASLEAQADQLADALREQFSPYYSRPLAKLDQAVKITDTSNQRKAKCETVSAVAIGSREDTEPFNKADSVFNKDTLL